jgi:endonuclease YncB( thermonuclease family)
MTTGWQNPIVAEARYRIDSIQQGMTEFNKIVLTDIKSLQNVHGDVTKLYDSARSLLISLDEDYQLLKEYISANKDTLSREVVTADGKRVTSGMVYYQFAMDMINKRLGSLESLIPVGYDIPSEQLARSSSTTEQSIPGTYAANPDPSFTGVCTLVEDGDTIVVDGRVIRFAGVDAPEGGTDSGKVSTQRLTDLILGKNVDVMVDRNTPRDLYGRWLGWPMLHTDNETELGKGQLMSICIWLLRNCLALPNLKFGKHHYVDPDEVKRAASACVWGWPQIGQYKIITDPSHSVVWVDGDFVGLSGSPVDISFGAHHVTVFKAGYSAYHFDLNVDQNIAQEIGPFTLLPLPVSTGLVEVHTSPNVRAILYINDQLVGVTPIVIDLPTDSISTLRSEADGYSSASEDVLPVIGSVTIVALSLSSTGSPPIVSPSVIPSAKIAGTAATPVTNVLSKSMVAKVRKKQSRSKK